MATLLYRPVLIESAEQAEALPIGTVLTRERQQPVEVTESEGRRHYGAPGRVARAPSAIGWTALVPTEAEEGTDTIETGEGHFYTRTRFVTPWEEA